MFTHLLDPHELFSFNFINDFIKKNNEICYLLLHVGLHSDLNKLVLKIEKRTETHKTKTNAKQKCRIYVLHCKETYSRHYPFLFI